MIVLIMATAGAWAAWLAYLIGQRRGERAAESRARRTRWRMYDQQWGERLDRIDS